MKKALILRILAILGFAAMASSCSTTYDAYGRPVQTVDPGLAVAGIAAAGILGYAIGNDGGHGGHGGHGGRNYGHGGHGRGHGGYCRY